MYRNYYLFKRQLDFLNNTLPGSTLTKCFTHRKDEMVISLRPAEQEEVFLRISLQIQLPYLLLYPGHVVKDPRTEFFPEISGTRLGLFSIIPFDKIIRSTVGIYSLEMYFFGHHPNILLMDEYNLINASFKKRTTNGEEKKHDLYINPTSFNTGQVLELSRQRGDHVLVDFLNHHFGGFNSLLSRELCHRCDIATDIRAQNLTAHAIDRIQQACITMITEMEQQPVRIYFDQHQPTHISLLTLHHLGKDAEYQIFDDVNSAWKEYIHFHQKQIRFHRLSGRLKEVVQNRLDYLQRSLDSMIESEELDQRKKDAELRGNLLLTHASKIPRGSRFVELENIFSGQQELIRIKLNPAKSIQANAAKYFEKYKDIDQKRLNASVRKETYLKESGYWKDLAVKLEHARSPAQIEKIEKELIERGSLQSEQIGEDREESLSYSFRRLLLGKKWEVFIGKNAQNNDLLTFKFANKFDLWFHAQGVAGSHLVLRLGSKNTLPPPEIIEQAASAAAFFSSAKHSGMVPVNYTQVRYVRKVKNTLPGTVLISNEKTVFVKPQKFI